MAELKNSVGQSGANAPDDVLLVQQQLNGHLARLFPAVRLIEDGVIGPQTIEAITEFQRRVVKLNNPDGRIDPGGPTWRALQQIPSPAAPTLDETPVNPAWPESVQAFVRQTLPAAREVKATWGVPVSVCIAQAALESGWGRTVKNNAYFGIKGKSLSGNSTDFTTSEFVDGQKITIQDTFRAYLDFAEAADDYGRFLSSNPRYGSCFAVKGDPLRFADELQAAHYATDPDYAEKVKHIIQNYGLTDYEAF